MKSLLKLATVAAVAVALNACSRSESKKPEQGTPFDQKSVEVKFMPQIEAKQIANNDEGTYYQIKLWLPNGLETALIEYSAALDLDQATSKDFYNMNYKTAKDDLTYISTFGTPAKAFVVAQWPSMESLEGKAYVFLRQENGSYTFQFDANLNSKYTKDDLVSDFVAAATDMQLSVDEYLGMLDGKDVEELIKSRTQAAPAEPQKQETPVAEAPVSAETPAAPYYERANGPK